MYRMVTLFILMVLFLMGPALANADNRADTIKLSIGQSAAQVDGAPYTLEAAPRVSEGVTLVPLRFIVESFGANVAWNNNVGEITVKFGDQLISLQPGSNKAYINSLKEHVLPSPPVVEKGVTLVPLRFLAENMNYRVQYIKAADGILIEQLPPPNQPPVAEFKMPKDTVAQGETLIYEDVSHDPDGDELVERKWQGKENAFFEPGEYTVSLTVKDSRGSWSEPSTKVITVTEEVKQDKLTYTLHNPIPGELLDISNIPVLSLNRVDPAVNMNREKIIISNSPETIREDGILYSDVSSGDNRIYYHHLNGTKETKTIYLLAVNQSDKPVKLTLKKWGAAGPSDPMAVGRVAAYRYLDFTPGQARFLELQPGEVTVLNQGINNLITPGQTAHGIFDVNAKDELLFVVAVAGDLDSKEDLLNLPVLSRDGNHVRGTFDLAKRNISVLLTDNEPARLVVADGKDDLFLRGKDNNTGKLGLVTKDMGNYGLVYSIRIKSAHRMGVILNPRGGVLAGAGNWDGKAFYIPNRGILKPQTEGALIGTIEPGKEKVFTFIPPAGSYLPVNLIFIPY